MKEKMLYPVRKDIGLGYYHYFNNANKSINNTVKRKKDYKQRKDVVEFADEEKSKTFNNKMLNGQSLAKDHIVCKTSTANTWR